MGGCISTQNERPFISQSEEMKQTQQVIYGLGELNKTISEETRLLTECRSTAQALIHDLQRVNASASDTLNAIVLTEKLDDAIEHMYPIKQTLLGLIDKAHFEYREFSVPFYDFRPTNRPMTGVMMIHAAGNSLSPDLYAAVRSGQRLRGGAEAIMDILQEKYDIN